MRDSGDDININCPPFKIFHTSIGIGPSNDQLSTDVLRIKCNTGKAALIREFLIKAADIMEAKGLGRFVPAGLANVIGNETMKNIIRNNNQYLKNVSIIPINGIPLKALYMEITIDEEEDEATKLMVYDYIMSAEWCQGIKPTNQFGRYFIITTHQQLNKAREWLDSNLQDMFLEHIPRYSTFNLIEGYPFPKRANKPCFHVQLGTYADLLRNQYTVNPNESNHPTKWNNPPSQKPDTQLKRLIHSIAKNTWNLSKPHRNITKMEPPNQPPQNNQQTSLHSNPSPPNPYKHK